MSLESISANEVDNYIGKDNIMVIDIRNNVLYKRGHILSAINIPYKDFDCKNCSIPKYYELILYCDRGNQSLLLGRELSKEGYQVKSLYGGIYAYRGRLVK